MKLAEVIDNIRTEKPNSFDAEKLTQIINEVEGEVAEALGLQFGPYTYAEDSGTELLARSPYDRLYKSYLKASIDFANEEYDSYQNNVAQYNSDIADFKAFVVREHASAKKIPRGFRNVW